MVERQGKVMGMGLLAGWLVGVALMLVVMVVLCSYGSIIIEVS